MNTECPAKINLRLRVFSADETGFHTLETIFARTDLADSLAIEESPEGLAIEIDGDAAERVPAGPDNLCWRAAEAFMNVAFGTRRARPGLTLRLTKRIRTGTGLGGGSADAGGVLRLLSERWPRVEQRTLFQIAGRLGSDVPFALLDVPMALGWERGRRLLPLRPPEPREGLILCPPFSVSTPDAYGWLDDLRAAEAPAAGASASPDPGGTSVLPGVSRLTEWDTIGRLSRNDLESPVLARYPELASALGVLREHGDIGAMTGSGSALFAVFSDAAARDRGSKALLESGFGLSRNWAVHEVRLPV